MNPGSRTLVFLQAAFVFSHPFSMEFREVCDMYGILSKSYKVFPILTWKNQGYHVTLDVNGKETVIVNSQHGIAL